MSNKDLKVLYKVASQVFSNMMVSTYLIFNFLDIYFEMTRSFHGVIF